MVKNLLKLAKEGEKKQVSQKNDAITKNIVEKPKTLSEKRDIMAKEKVEELLQDVNLSLSKPTELIEIESHSENDTKNTEWLEEQIELLTEKNAQLKAEYDLAKSDYEKIFNSNRQINSGLSIVSDDDIKYNVINVFNELQKNYLQFGDGFIIYPVAFMNRLVMFFPFLDEFKRF